MDTVYRGIVVPFSKGQYIEHYQIVDILTPTRFGYIYLGRHLHQPVQVLIEGLLPPLLDLFKEDFLKSGQALKNLAHPHILPVRTVGVEQYYPCIVADYLPYRAFRQVYAPQSAQTLQTILPHLQQIASALDYMHSQHLLHGDIRSENILFSANTTVLLRGFLLKAIVQNRAHLKYQGVEAAEQSALIYAAPEQIQGHACPASDQYALGVLVYKLLCGQAPFSGSSVEIAFQKMHAPAPSLRQKAPDLILPAVEQVVMRSLAREPEKRFSDVRAFIDALEGAQQASRNLNSVAPARLQKVSVSPPVAPMFQEVVPRQAPPPGDPAIEPLVPRARKPKKVKRKRSQPRRKQPARRREGVSLARRLFAVGLVGVAAFGGAGGWYILSRRFARAALPLIAAQTGLPATQTLINQQKGLIFTGHLASVNAVAWSPDGKFIASASDDTFVQVFESATGTRRLIYRGHTEEVADVAWSPDGHTLASAGQDCTVQIWNAASGTPVFTYKAHTDRVNSVSWSSKGDFLASGSDDKSVQTWTASSGDRTFLFLGHTAGVLCVGWQPDESSVASGSWDGTLRDWATVQHGNHFNAGEQIFDYGGHAENEVYALAWSPDGTSMASGDEDGNVYVWRVAGRKVVFRYTGHKGAVNAVTWSPDGTFIASASSDATVHVWRPG